jgi:glycine betaine/proline transport system substrate-binding protein
VDIAVNGRDGSSKKPINREEIMSFTRTWKSALFAAVAVAAPILAPSSAGAVESNDPIKIVLFDWTSVNLNAKILGGVLEKLGYTVEYPTGD